MKPLRCTQCGQPLAEDAKSCPACGAVAHRRGTSSSHNRAKTFRRFSMPDVSPVTLAFMGLALLVLAIGIVALDSGGSEPEASSSSQSSNSIPDVHDDQEIPYPEVPRISLADAKAQYDANTAVFVDVRSSDEYEAAHIPGAISLPLAELQARYQELPADALIFLYCT